MTECCPLCGHELRPKTTVWNPNQRTLLTGTGVTIEFTHREASLFHAIWERYPAYVGGGPLLREVWGNYVYAQYVDQHEERNVNRLRTPDLVRTNIHRINKKLRGSGIRVELKGPYRGWRVAFDEHTT